MSLVANFPVTTTAQRVISGNATCRAVKITNNAVGAGNVYYQFSDRLPIPGSSPSTLTTANGTLVAFQPNPAQVILTPGYPQSTVNSSPSSTSDDSDGFDLWLISNSTAQVTVQTVPI